MGIVQAKAWLVKRGVASGPEAKPTRAKIATVILILLTAVANLKTTPNRDMVAANRQQALACALDRVGVPLAWGIAAAIHQPPNFNSYNHSFATGQSIAEWITASVSDGYFFPRVACSKFFDTRTPDAAHECAIEMTIFVSFQILERHKDGAMLSSAIGASNCLFAKGLPRREAISCAAMRVSQLIIFYVYPSGVLSYFASLHAEMLWPQFDSQLSKHKCVEKEQPRPRQRFLAKVRRLFRRHAAPEPHVCLDSKLEL